MGSPCIYTEKYENAPVHVLVCGDFQKKEIFLKNACDNNAGKLFDLPYLPLFGFQLLYSVSVLNILLLVLENIYLCCTNYNSLL